MKLLRKSARLVLWTFGVCGLFVLLSVVGLVMGTFLLALTLGAL